MARKDLSAREVEQMVEEHGPGSAAQYLAERRDELLAEEQERREADDEARFIAEFVEAGGDAEDGAEVYRRLRNEKAARQAAEAAEAATVLTRKHIARQL